MTDFFQQLVNGLSVGSIYALIALGYTMVYGVLGLINFAHGEVFMVGTYIGLFVAVALGYSATAEFSPWLVPVVMVVAMTGAAAIGVTIERFVYRPVRNAPRLTPLITALGASMLLQNLAVLFFGATPRRFPDIIRDHRYNFGGVTVSNVEILIFIVSVGLMLALHFLVQRTWVGRSMRAVSTNLPAARLMGVNADRTIAATFAIGSSLAAAGGILYGLDQTIIAPQSGNLIGLKAFVAAVLGGIGNIPGAVLGGFLIGVAEQMTSAYLSAAYRDAITFVILISILLLRPEGLLGVVRQEKV